MSQQFSEVEDPFLPPAPTKWPTILGWIMLIWGVLGVISYIWSLASNSLAVETYQGLPNWMVAAVRMSILLGIAMSLLGVVAGWFLRKKKRRGYSLTMIWVVLSLAITVVTVAIQIIGREDMQALMQRKLLEVSDKIPQPPLQMTPEMIKGIWFAQVGCPGIMGILPPLVIGFILISPKRRAEVATWTS
ncbi:MAG: hypothetical protein EXS12_02265 [Phycisphaerales bacterium]|nr:hypothetical protein [Phycisphaerales bacterium]